MSDRLRRSVQAPQSTVPATESRVGRMFQEEEDRVQAKADKAHMPFRFWLEPGAECEVTILDESLEAGFARPEHNLKGADGKYGNIVPCIRNEAECPVCKSDRESTVVLYLSVLVHRPYTSKKTGEVKPHSKMFLCLKRGQYADFARIEKTALKKYNTLRGITLLLSRDKEKNSYGTGMPIPGEEGNVILDFYGENDLVASFGHKEIKNREGNKVIRPANDDITPYNYKALMPAPDVDEFLEEFGAGAAPGSRRASKSYKEEEDTEDQESTTAAVEEAPRPRRRAAAPVEEEAPAPLRARRGRTAPEKKETEEDEIDFS
jgi:hypothetical protein